MKIISLAAIFLAVATTPLAGASPSSSSQSPGPRGAALTAMNLVRDMLRNYGRMKTVHFSAVVRGRLIARPGKTAHGGVHAILAHYVFWGSGERYREVFRVLEPAAWSADDFQSAYDGKRYQFLSEPSHTLFISKHFPKGAVTPAIPNPLAQPAMFLADFPLPPGHPNMTFAILATGAGRLSRLFLGRFMHGGKFRAAAEGRPAELQVSAGGHGNARLIYQVSFARRPGFLPAEIRVVDHSGRTLIINKFRRYLKLGPAGARCYIASEIISVVRAKGAIPGMRTVISLRGLLVGPPLPPNILTINFRLANAILDGNTRSVMMVPRDHR